MTRSGRADGFTLPTPDGLLVLRSAHLEVVVDPTYGAEIRSITRPGETANSLAHYNWSTPARARDGQRYDNAALDWLSNYRGGWQECFPNSGADAPTSGITTPFHGEASTSRWEVVEIDADAATLRVASRVPLVLTRTMRLAPDAPCLFIEERIDNVGPFDVDCIWAHHPVFPALAGTRIDLPPCEVAVEPANHDGVLPEGGRWPRVPGPDGDVDLSLVDDRTAHRLTYQHGLTAGWVALRPPTDQSTPGMALAWDLETWPHLWMWLLGGTSEFPWFGRARMIGLEPNRSWPFDGLTGAISRGQQLTVPRGGSHHSWLTYRLLDDDTPVTGLGREGILEVVSSGGRPTLDELRME